LAIAKCGHKWQYLDNETQTGDRKMTIVFTSKPSQMKSTARRYGVAKKIEMGAKLVRYVETADGWIYNIYA
jgi:hypothetical protein